MLSYFPCSYALYHGNHPLLWKCSQLGKRAGDFGTVPFVSMNAFMMWLTEYYIVDIYNRDPDNLFMMKIPQKSPFQPVWLGMKKQ